MECNAQLSQTYLATRYLVNGRPAGYIDVSPNTVIAVLDSLCISNKKQIQPIGTDKYGRIAWAKASLASGKPIQALKIEHEIIIPPSDVLAYINTLYSDLWADKLSALIETYKGTSIKLKRQRIRFKDIRPPVKELSPNLKQRKKELLYEDWYSKLQGADISGFVMPKIRAVLFTFSSEQLLYGEVFFYRIGGDTSTPIQADIEKADGSNNFVATYIDDRNVLKANELYHIKVVLRKNRIKGLWKGGLAKNIDSHYYELSKSFHFKITNPLGEFEIVNCEPVTVEELMITQFPKQFSHLIEAAKNLNLQEPHSVLAENKSKNKKKQPTDGLISYAQQLEVGRGYTHMATGALLSPERSKLGVALSKILHQTLEQYQNDDIKALAEMSFGGASTWYAWKEVRDALTKAASNSNIAVPVSQLIKENWFSLRAYQNLSGTIDDFENTMAYRINGSANLIKLIDKFAKPLDIAHSGYGLLSNGMSYQQLNEDADMTAEKLDDLFQQFHEKIGRHELSDEAQSPQITAISLLFDLNKFNIQNQYHSALTTFAARLKEDETLSVALQGYTDNIGTDEFNYYLSRDRACSVRDYLIEQGIESKRLFIVANGEADPVASNQTDEGRAENRRVEALVQQGEALATYSYCREAVGNIERLRNLSNDKLIQQSERIDQGLNSLINMALGVATCVPATSVAAMVMIAAKESTSALSSAVEVLDQQLGSRYLKQYKDSKRLVNNLESHSLVNQQLMRDIPFNTNPSTNRAGPQALKALNQPDTPAHYLHLQYRIRSEALTGLMLIITRALVSANYPDAGDKRLDELQGVDWEDETESAKGREILFKLKLKKYRVEEYVQTMILNDQWTFPLKPIAPMTIDRYWVYENNPYRLRDGEDPKEDTIFEKGVRAIKGLVSGGLEVLSDASIINVAQHGTDELVRDIAHFYSQLDVDLPGHTRADFQRCFPVHHLASSDISQFCQVFKTEYPELSTAYLLHTNIHYKNSNTDQQSEWRPMAERFVVNDYTNHVSVKPLSPTQPLRILVVLKEEYAEGIYPIRLQLCRQDTIPDVKGPVYTDITQELKSEALLEDEQQFVGMRGCIFYPFYKLGQSTLFGAKPLGSFIGLNVMDADRYYQWGHLDMDIAFNVCIGKRDELEHPVRFSVGNGKKGSEWEKGATGHSKYWNQQPEDVVYRESFRTQVDKKRPHQALMIDKDFLLDRAATTQYPPLFNQSDYQNVAVLVRIPDERGQGQWVLPHASFSDDIKQLALHMGIPITLEGERAISFEHFDWATPVEFMVVAMTSNIENDRYESLGNAWKHLNLAFELEEFNFVFKNTQGPKLTKTMHYLGEMNQVTRGYYQSNNPTPIVFKADENPHVKKNPAFNELLTLFENSAAPKWKEKMEALAGWFGVSAQESNKRYLFASHYVPDYESPTGHIVKGIRPFGEDRVEMIDTKPPQLKAESSDPFRYQFGAFKTPGKTGFSCENASLYVTPTNKIPYEFRFGVPEQYDGDAPWMKEPENPKDSILKQADIKGKEATDKAYLNKLKAIKKWIEKDTRSIRIDRNELYK